MAPTPPSTVISDFRTVLTDMGRDGKPRIIVGGQAVNVWAEHYRPSEPALAAYEPFTSKDLDLLGDEQDLTALARRTGLSAVASQRKLFIPTVGCLLLPRGNDEPVKIEILKRVYGVLAGDIAAGAVRIEHGDLSLRVVDPITLLEAKTCNAAELPQERRQDVKHVKIMLLCVRAYLRDIVCQASNGALPARSCVAALERLLQVASTRAATTATRKYDIHWLDALPLRELRAATDPRLRNFVAKRLRQWEKRTAKKSPPR